MMFLVVECGRTPNSHESQSRAHWFKSHLPSSLSCVNVHLAVDSDQWKCEWIVFVRNCSMADYFPEKASWFRNEHVCQGGGWSVKLFERSNGLGTCAWYQIIPLPFSIFVAAFQKRHVLTAVYVVTPVLCTHCKYYDALGFYIILM